MFHVVHELVLEGRCGSCLVQGGDGAGQRDQVGVITVTESRRLGPVASAALDPYQGCCRGDCCRERGGDPAAAGQFDAGTAVVAAVVVSGGPRRCRGWGGCAAGGGGRGRLFAAGLRRDG